ncbi:MAG: radical SAM protein [Proteobacteria bacterium]|nr:radical SAM protein [Pseudomonadota bacterium]
MDTETTGKIAFETGIYRPPSEGGSYSLLVRVTRNCPWNRCTFCSMYKEEKFKLRSVEELKRDIDSIAAVRDKLKSISEELGYNGEINRQATIEMVNREPSLGYSHGFGMVLNWLFSGGKTAFIQDANSLIMKSERLVEILKYLRKTFPTLERVTTYARSKTIAKKEADELKEIRSAGLDRLHVGLETGDDELLQKIKKGVTSEEQIIAGRKAVAAGFQLSEYWMPGLGGLQRWRQHAQNTARVLNEIDPHYIRSRPFFPSPNSPMLEEFQRGDLQLLTPGEQLVEIKLMVEELDFTAKVCFDHGGNHWTSKEGASLFSLSYEGYKFPEKKNQVLGLIEEGLENHNSNDETVS